MSSTVGRDRELRDVAAFLDPDGAPRVLLIEGEPGIGKTTVWEDASAAAEERWRVLRSSPLEVEARISFAAVGDLVGGCLGDVDGELPAPQLRALEVALLLAEPGAVPADPQAIAFAFLSVLRILSRSRPLLVAVDDLQWLDQPSATTLLYAARRVENEPIRFLLARRSTADAVDASFERAFRREHLQRITLGPLSRGAVQRLVHEHLGTSFSRPVLNEIHAVSGGNPFYALELARSLPGPAHSSKPESPLRIPSTLSALVDDRLGRLPPTTEHALQIAAVLAQPTIDTVAAVLGEPPELGPAVSAEVIEIAGSTIEFTHPLLVSGLAARIEPGRRRDLHRRIAAVVADPEEHARHLAQATAGPDPETVAALERAAAHARNRGAPEVASELLERALLLVPPDDGTRHRRLLAASEASREAGDWARARSHAEEAVSVASTGSEQAQALLQLGLASSSPLPSLLTARERVEDDPALEARVLLALADARLQVSFPDAHLDACDAVEAARRAGDSVLIAQAYGSLAWLEGALNLGDPLATIDGAVELERTGTLDVPSVYTSEFNRGTLAMWKDDHDAARAAFDSQLRGTRDRGDVYGQAHTLLHLAQVEWRAGNWPTAWSHATEALDLWPIDEAQGRAALLWIAAVIAAHRGEAADAEGMSEEALGASPDDRLYRARHTWVLGVVAALDDDPELALGRLAEVSQAFDELGASEPGMTLHAPDLIEAYVALDRLEEAAAYSDVLERRGVVLSRPRAVSIGARGRGLALAAAGDLEGSLAAFEHALGTGERWDVPLERGRTLLALGTTQRRLRRRREARATLEEGLGVFEDLGATPFAERARAELGRIGGRAPSRGELTATELQVARLVAEGKTNKEVAAILVVAPRTVESTLTQVYRKLDVRSRTELARKLAGPV